jgi:hypothetical protein
MIRTVSLWIRIDGKYVHPSYANSKQTQLKPQDGEYYLRFAGRYVPVYDGKPAFRLSNSGRISPAPMHRPDESVRDCAPSRSVSIRNRVWFE